MTTWVGRPDLGLVAGLGAFAVLYGADTPGRFRIKLMSAMAAGFVLSARLGVLAAAVHPVLILVLLAALCVTLKIEPPGSDFLVLVSGAASYLVDQGGPPAHVIGMTAVGEAPQ